MDLEYYDKIKYLFSLSKNDMRPIILLIILHSSVNQDSNEVNDNTLELYRHMVKNDEWKTYCRDLLYAAVNYSNTLSVHNFVNNLPIYTKKTQTIISRFFKIEYNRTDITNNIVSWKNATHITLVPDILEQFFNIQLPVNYVPSTNTQFEFNSMIIKSILRSIVGVIPQMKTIDVDLINPVHKCFSKEKKYLDYLENCFKGKDVSKCKAFMNQPSYSSTIKEEVNTMDVCVATELLIKFGFKYNKKSSICFEQYTSWEKRMITILQIKSINPNLKKYIELLLERVNSIKLLKKELMVKGSDYSIALVLKQYVELYPRLKTRIDRYNEVELQYNKSQYILSNYRILMKLFNNTAINSINLSIYEEHYNKMYSKFMSEQALLLDYIEHQL